jgi:putative sigma-54 modulation protein
MQILVKGRHMPVGDSLNAYAQEKVGKVAKILDREDMTVEIVLHVEKNPANKNRDVAEVTARTKGTVIRAEEAAPDMYAAIDLVAEKLERQVRKFKTRVVDRHSGKGHRAVEAVKTAPGDAQIAAPEEVEASVVRTKSVEIKPMSQEEAILQLELLGHDFMLFQPEDADRLAVLYRRNDGDYGIIQAQQ